MTSIIKKWKNKVITMTTSLIERVGMEVNGRVNLKGIITSIDDIAQRVAVDLFRLKQTVFLQEENGKVKLHLEKGSILTPHQYFTIVKAYTAGDLYS